MKQVIHLTSKEVEEAVRDWILGRDPGPVASTNSKWEVRLFTSKDLGVTAEAEREIL